MSSAIIMNLTAIAVIVAGWTAAVWAFYTRLDSTRTRPRTVHHNAAQAPSTAPLPEPALVGNPA